MVHQPQWTHTGQELSKIRVKWKKKKSPSLVCAFSYVTTSDGRSIAKREAIELKFNGDGRWIVAVGIWGFSGNRKFNSKELLLHVQYVVFSFSPRQPIPPPASLLLSSLLEMSARTNERQSKYGKDKADAYQSLWALARRHDNNSTVQTFFFSFSLFFLSFRLFVLFRVHQRREGFIFPFVFFSVHQFLRRKENRSRKAEWKEDKNIWKCMAVLVGVCVQFDVKSEAM